MSRKKEGMGEDSELESYCAVFPEASLEGGTFGWEEAGLCL